jgi:hypothetical protein
VCFLPETKRAGSKARPLATGSCYLRTAGGLSLPEMIFAL